MAALLYVWRRNSIILCTRLKEEIHLQEMLVSRSSDTLKALAELDAAELKRHKQNTLLWEVSTNLRSVTGQLGVASIDRCWQSILHLQQGDGVQSTNDRALRQAEVFHVC